MKKANKVKFPQFSSHVCVGDTIKWEKDGFDFAARIAYDEDTSINDFDCYTEKAKKAWLDDDWFFVGVILSVSKNDVELSDHAASLWGIDCNFPSRRKNPNYYLSEVAQDLESEALEEAHRMQNKIVAALT